MHAASLGEFEQGRPIIEAIRSHYPEEKIVLTFFSPSGYEVRKDYELADAVFYLPLDSPRRSKTFVDAINPKLALFIKYEFWYYYLKELNSRKIPTLMVSSIFRSNQLFFHWSGRFFHHAFRKVDTFFVQDQQSKELIGRISSNVVVSGDTRFDRVHAIACEAEPIRRVEEFIGDEEAFVFGSIWDADLAIIGDFIAEISSSKKVLIAPHNINNEQIETLQRRFDKVVCYSDGNTGGRIMIIDNYGMLSSLYRYGKYAYVGGGFRGALHNTLEAAVFGIPVFIGKHENNAKFREAIQLRAVGGIVEIESLEHLWRQFQQFEDDHESYEKAADASGTFVNSRLGATQKVMERVTQLI